MNSDNWDDFAADWDTRPDVREYADRAFKSFQRRVLPLVPKMVHTRVMDFGCGTGLLTEKLSPLCDRVVALDSSSRMMEILNRKLAKTGTKNVTSLVATVDSKTIDENRDILGQFDLVVASSVCSFLPDFQLTLCDISTIMRPNAIFVHWDWLDDLPPSEIRSAFSQAGLNCIRAEREFEMVGNNGSMEVVMGIGKRIG